MKNREAGGGERNKRQVIGKKADVDVLAPEMGDNNSIQKQFFNPIKFSASLQ